MTDNDSLTDIQQVRDAAQLLLDAFDNFRAEDPASLSEPLRGYASTVSAVNQRLISAHALLAQGRRAEAIHACDAEPNLLDCVEELDATDQAVEAWLAMISDLGYPRPQRLNVDFASELGASYDIKHQLDSLMRTHRILAISRGPIEQRVATLRRIVRMDPDNPRWIEDLTAYEKECKQSLEEQLGRLAVLPAAEVTPDMANRAVKLGAELSNSDWCEPLDGNAVRRVKGLVKQVRTASAKKELPALLARVAEAYTARDLPAARMLLERLQQFEDGGAIDSSRAQTATLQACREWVTEQDNAESIRCDLQAAEAEVRRMCGEPMPFLPAAANRERTVLQRELSRLHSLATATRDDTQAPLLSAATLRIRRLNAVGVRFWLTAVTTSLTAIVVAAGVASWRAHENHRSHVLAQANELLESLAADKPIRIEDMQATTSRWQSLLEKDPWLSDQHVATRYEERLKDIGDKANREEISVRKALDLLKPSVDEVLPRYLAALSERGAADTSLGKDVQDAKEDAKKEIRTTTQHAAKANSEIRAFRSSAGDDRARPFDLELRDLRSQLEGLQKQFTDKVDSISQQAHARIDTELDRLEDMPRRELSDHSDSIRSLERQAESLERFMADSQERRRDPRLTNLRDRLERLNEEIGLRKKIDACTERLDLAGSQGGAVTLLDAIEEEARALPASSAATDLRTIARERPCIESALKWASVSLSWTGDLSCPRKNAEKWLKAITDARDAQRRPVLEDQDRTNLDNLISFLKEREARIPEERLTLIEESLDLPVLRDDVIVVAGTDRMYYTRADKQPDGWYFRDERRINKFSDRVKKAVAPLPAAPPAILAAVIRDCIKDVRDGRIDDYDSGLLKAFSLFVNPKHEKVDPVIKCIMLSLILDALNERSMFTDNQELNRLRGNLLNNFDPATSWVDPEQARDRDADKTAKDLLQLPRLNAIKASYDTRRKAVESRPWPIENLVYVGWTDPSGDNGALRRAKPNEPIDGRLVIVKPSGDTSFELHTIGDVRAGKHSLNPGARLAYGRPVFLVSDSRPRGVRGEAPAQ